MTRSASNARNAIPSQSFYIQGFHPWGALYIQGLHPSRFRLASGQNPRKPWMSVLVGRTVAGARGRSGPVLISNANIHIHMHIHIHICIYIYIYTHVIYAYNIVQYDLCWTTESRPGPRCRTSWQGPTRRPCQL